MGPVRTRFRYGFPPRVNLATDHQLAGSFLQNHAITPAPKRLRLSRLVGTRFQVLFHSPPGVLFTFPSRYLSAIGHQGVFRLSGWSRQIHTEFHGLGATRENTREDHGFRVRGSHPLRRPLPEAFHQPTIFLTPSPAGRPTRMLPQPRPHNPCRVSHATGLA